MSLLNPSYLQAGRIQQEIAKFQEKCKLLRPPTPENNEEEIGPRPKKRRSRWADPDAGRIFIPGMPTVLPTNLTREQEQAYLLQLQIEEVTRKLRSGDLGIPLNPEERSPSPEPIYSHDGKRLNTREYRTRKALEEERHSLICRMQSINPDYKPPIDYKPPMIRVSDKVMIPQDDFPDINFVGLLIGPRGNTLKTMEKDTGAKIIIRGKGSVKEGKVGRKDGQPLPGEDEPLHAYVTATNPEAVKKAVERIKEVIKQGVEVPEGQNDLRRHQLRELALLNGTLREADGPRCSNCGATDHKHWMCPDKPNVTKQIICGVCGGSGHISKDCRAKLPPGMVQPGAAPLGKIDEEYMSLMAELGEAPPPDMVRAAAAAPSTTAATTTTPTNNTRFQAPRNLFEPRGPIKPLMAPENTVGPPPGLAPPPWTATTAPPPPAPPPGLPPMMMPQMWQTPAMPPPPPPPSATATVAAAAIPPPPPPPPPASNAAIPPLLPWLQNSAAKPAAAVSAVGGSTAIPPWQPPPPPPSGGTGSAAVPPPPPSGNSAMYPPWQQGYGGAAPPPPPPPQNTGGYPNLVPPPPPPPS